MRSLIEQVRIIPADGEVRIELKGELAEILVLAEGQKRCSGWLGDRALQIKSLRGLDLTESRNANANRSSDFRDGRSTSAGATETWTCGLAPRCPVSAGKKKSLHRADFPQATLMSLLPRCAAQQSVVGKRRLP